MFLETMKGVKMNLDKFQSKAVHAEESMVAVVATPGSGKTRTLCARVLHLIKDKGIHPSDITLLTFTRYAANSLKERLGEEGRGVFIGTFHAFALQVIMSYGHELGWEPSWLTILDEEEAKAEEEDALNKVGVVDRNGKWKIRNRESWENIKKILFNREKEVPSDIHPAHITAFNTWMNRLKAENVMTYNSLIYEALELLERIEGVIEHFSGKHVLVDEAQDTSGRQWRMLELIEPKALFIVGDVDQAIYSWRGAQPEMFIKYVNESTRYDLPYSYRFDFNIATPANNLIKHNADRLDIAIDAIANHEGNVEVKKGAQFEDVVDLIEGELNEGTPVDDIVVLGRRHWTLDLLAEKMEQKKMPILRIGGKKSLTATTEFRVVKGYLRLAVNPGDKRAFMAVANVEGISNTRLLELRDQALEDDISLLEAYQKELPNNLDKIEEYLGRNDKNRSYSGAMQYVKTVQKCEGFETLAELSRYLSVEHSQDQLRNKKGKVSLCTIHSAKGLEWPVVFIVGMNAAEFPNPRSLREGGIEDERRLMYVGMTRAENSLYMVNMLPQNVKDEESMFLEEIVE